MYCSTRPSGDQTKSAAVSRKYYADWALHLGMAPGRQLLLAQRALALWQQALSSAAPHGPVQRSVVVRGLSNLRGPASVAQTLYEETAESLARRAQVAEQRRQGTEPAQSIEQGRPTKRDRRQLADWNRWSASIDPE